MGPRRDNHLGASNLQEKLRVVRKLPRHWKHFYLFIVNEITQCLTREALTYFTIHGMIPGDN